MNKSEKLSLVFENAERVSFDDRSRLVFFSDVHRGDNSWADEFAPNAVTYSHALEYYYRAGFTYVEVGDGDELLKNTGWQSIRTAHAGVYEKLREFYTRGRLYYLHGNHDIPYSGKQTAEQSLGTLYDPFRAQSEPLFPGIKVHEGLVLVHEETGGELFVTHGHQGEILNDRFWKVSRFLLRFLWRPLQLLGIQNPSRVSSNPEIRKDIERQLCDWIRDNEQPLLCGHTHLAHFSRAGEAPYFNTGSCVHPRWITGIEIDQGEIMLVRWRVKPGERGGLYIHREVLAGPERVADYYQKEPLPQDNLDLSLAPRTSPRSGILEEARM